MKRVLKCYHRHLPDTEKATNITQYSYAWFWRICLWKWQRDFRSKTPRWAGQQGHHYIFEKIEG